MNDYVEELLEQQWEVDDGEGYTCAADELAHDEYLDECAAF